MKPINEGANPLMEPVDAGMLAPSPSKYYWTQRWSAHRITCRKLVRVLERQNGWPGCMGGRTFIEADGDEPQEIAESWDWIQAQRGNKKLWVLSHEDSDGSLVDG